MPRGKQKHHWWLTNSPKFPYSATHKKKWMEKVVSELIWFSPPRQLFLPLSTRNLPQCMPSSLTLTNIPPPIPFLNRRRPLLRERRFDSVESSLWLIFFFLCLLIRCYFLLEVTVSPSLILSTFRNLLVIWLMAMTSEMSTFITPL